MLWLIKLIKLILFPILNVFFSESGVCADLKNRHGCGAGSQHEKFMKKHCRKTCGLRKMLVLVTGGKREGLNSTALLNMDGTWNCPMPPMPEPRWGHSQTGPIVCGGNGGRKSCITFINGDDNWKQSHSLDQLRRRHTAWDSPQGVVLLGGYDSSARTTSEILLENGDKKPGSNLDYQTRLVWQISRWCQHG